jgi:hypothetical protein
VGDGRELEHGERLLASRLRPAVAADGKSQERLRLQRKGAINQPTKERVVEHGSSS